MSDLLRLLEAAHSAAGRGFGQHALLLAQRRANRLSLGRVAKDYRQAADLVDQALAAITSKEP